MTDATPSTTARPVPQPPDESGHYEYAGYHQSFWRKEWVQQVLPWTTSLLIHGGLIVVALVALVAYREYIAPPAVQQQAGIPTATLATDGQIGSVPNVGNVDDLTSQNKSLNPVADSSDFRAQGEGESASDLLTPTAGGQAANISGITGMGALSDALGGGGGEGSPLFGEAGGASGFMGIDIGTPGTGGAVYRIAFVCDSSGSMDAEKRVLLFSELKKAVEPLTVDQAFNVVFFQDGDYAAAFPGELKPATRRFKDDLNAFLDGVTMAGQTNPIPALQAAFEMEPELIFFLTDGQFNGIAGYDDVLATLDRLNPERRAMVNAIQFLGNDPNAEQVLRQIAERHGGTYKEVTRDDL